MKQIIFLAFLALCGVSAFCRGDDRPPPSTPLKPYTAFAWNATAILPHVKQMYVISRTTPPGVAAQVSARMPEGARVLLAPEFPGAIFEHPDDVCVSPEGKPLPVQGVWPVHGQRVTAEYTDNWFAAFEKAGGKIDFLVLDYEGGFSNWAMNEARLLAIGADPRFPMLAKDLGFDDARKADMWKSGPAGEYLRWNAVMGRVAADALDVGMFIPVRRHFPRAGMSNYNNFAMTAENVVPDAAGHFQYSIAPPMGTHQSPAFYGAAAPANRIEADWLRSPFLQVVYAANFMRGIARSSNRSIIPWIGYRNWTDMGGRSTVWGNTDYYQEGVYHLLLSGGTTNVFYFNPTPARKSFFEKPAPNTPTPVDNETVETIFADIEKQAKGKPIVASAMPESVPWDTKALVSAGKLADGTMIARVTFAENVKEATVTVAGKLYKVAKPAGKAGVWLELK